ncbi:Schlafen Family Member 13 [Manis pentadactyla]|nr:Schlafen Family Member 13 [Manis pentadactyla]
MRSTVGLVAMVPEEEVEAPEFYIQQLCGHAIWIFLNLFQLTVVKPEATDFLLPPPHTEATEEDVLMIQLGSDYKADPINKALNLAPGPPFNSPRSKATGDLPLLNSPAESMCSVRTTLIESLEHELNFED